MSSLGGRGLAHPTGAETCLAIPCTHKKSLTSWHGWPPSVQKFPTSHSLIHQWTTLRRDFHDQDRNITTRHAGKTGIAFERCCCHHCSCAHRAALAVASG